MLFRSSCSPFTTRWAAFPPPSTSRLPCKPAAATTKCTSNILSKLDFVVDDEEYNRATAVTSDSNEPDGYEYIAIYINENLNPDYDATGDGTAERNIAILKENMDKLPEDIKDYAFFYIEDIELNIKMSKLEEESDFRKKKEKENALKVIAYSK